MKKNNLILLLAVLILLPSCQSVKDGLSGAKENNSDEFLVKKKNPLVLPPKYLELPKPYDAELEEQLAYNEEFDIKKIIGIDSKTEDEKDETVSVGSAEDFVLKNIKNN